MPDTQAKQEQEIRTGIQPTDGSPTELVRDFLKTLQACAETAEIEPFLSEAAKEFMRGSVYPGSCEEGFLHMMREETKAGCRRRMTSIRERVIAPETAIVVGGYECMTGRQAVCCWTQFIIGCVREGGAWKVNFYSAGHQMPPDSEADCCACTGSESCACGEPEHPRLQGDMVEASCLCEQIPTAVFTCRGERERFALCQANRRMLNKLGYASLEEMKYRMGDSVINSIHPDDLGAFVQLMRRQQLEGADDTIQVRLRRQDFSYHWFLLQSNLQTDCQGKPVLMCLCVEHPGKNAGEERPAGADPGTGDGQRPSVTVRTFGFFDLFVNGQAVAFRHPKAKELLALLVDRRGGYVSQAEAISCLWEEEPVNKTTLARYRKTAMYLKDTLAELRIGDILEVKNGQRKICPERFTGDLYEYLRAPEEKRGGFGGNYLLNYSWGEVTLGLLEGLNANS